MDAPTFRLQLPDWLRRWLSDAPRYYHSDHDRMRLVIRLARENILHATGGPFGAAIFEAHSGLLLAPGVNLVLSSNCSVMHAEIVAIIMAQQVVQTFDLARADLPRYELVTSAEPCAMCMGAVPWSGVCRVVCGARDQDVRAIGFDEGAKPHDWIGELKRRGIAVTRDVLREEAAAVLQAYAEQQGIIYNSGGPG
jgi:tRNA(Arg) A34 adenosine deaminase TadA